MTVLLQDGARESAPAHHENRLVVLFQLVHQRDEVAVAADDRECINVIVRKGHLQRVQRQVDIRAVFVAAR